MLRIITVVALVLPIVIGCARAEDTPEARQARREIISGTLATYDGEPRNAERRVDITRLVAELKELHCNTYDFLIWHRETDWADLEEFLRATKDSDLKVWVSLVPPSESKTTKSEPFGLDYVAWAGAIAHLSTTYPNLVAWSIDDFTHNLSFYNPDYLGKMMDAAHAENPHLAFVPCTYFSRVNPALAENYGDLLDGLLFYYRHESAGANLSDPSLCEEEIAKVKQIMGPDMPIILGFYATGHSRLGQTTPEYCEHVMKCGREHAEGVHVYCHQAPGTPKYELIKRLFSGWNPTVEN
jgi:hypothetical protein